MGNERKRKPANPLKWHGGKFFLAPKILAVMPKHTHYVEPFFGGGAVLLAKNPKGVSEVVNDIDGEVTNFFRVLKVEATFAAFKRIVDAIPFSKAEFDAAANADGGTDVERAVRFFVRCRQSRAGNMKGFSPLSRTRVRSGMNEQASAWMNAVEGLAAVAARLKRVVILNDDACTVIRAQDGVDTLFYCDPPYLHSTRASKDAYAFEMTEEDHRKLLALLTETKGKVILSGYRSDLYGTMLPPPKWTRLEFDVPNNVAGGDAKRRMVENLWLNYAPPDPPLDFAAPDVWDSTDSADVEHANEAAPSDSVGKTVIAAGGAKRTTDPLGIWRRYLDPKRVLEYPLVRPASTFMTVEDKLSAVANVLATLDDSHPDERDFGGCDPNEWRCLATANRLKVQGLRFSRAVWNWRFQLVERLGPRPPSSSPADYHEPYSRSRGPWFRPNAHTRPQPVTPGRPRRSLPAKKFRFLSNAS